MNRQQLISQNIFISVLSIILFTLSVNIALADGPIAPQATPGSSNVVLTHKAPAQSTTQMSEAAKKDSGGHNGHIFVHPGGDHPNGNDPQLGCDGGHIHGFGFDTNVQVIVEIRSKPWKTGNLVFAQTLTTNDQGEFITNSFKLPDGHYKVFAWQQNWDPKTEKQKVFKVHCSQCEGTVTATKIDQDGNPWNGITINLFGTDGSLVERGLTPVTFDHLELGDYSIEEVVPENSEPMGPTHQQFTLNPDHCELQVQFQNRRLLKGSVSADKIDELGNPWVGVEIELLRDGQIVAQGKSPVTFDNLELGHYLIREIVPEGSQPLGPTEVEFTLDQQHLNFVTQFQNRRPPQQISCDKVNINPSSGNELSIAGENIAVEVQEIGSTQANNTQYQIVNVNTNEVVAGPTSQNTLAFLGYPEVDYQAQKSSQDAGWNNVCDFKYSAKPIDPAVCTLTTSQDMAGNTLVNLGAVDENGQKVVIDQFKANSNFSYTYPPTPAANLPVSVYWPGADQGEWFIRFEVSTDNGQSWLGGDNCQLDYQRQLPTTGQYQDFIGAVPFGTFTPNLEPGKEYFDMTRSIMYNLEYFNANQGEVVYRFNGQEIDGVVSSLFHAGSFNQIQSHNRRAVTTFKEGVTKLIAYRYGQEQARIFQTMSATDTRWIHPLDQPFEHKYQFKLELHGPAGTTDLLVYGNQQPDVHYDQNGLAIVDLTYNQPGLVAIYPTAAGLKDVNWITVDSVTFPITTSQTVNYNFAETGLQYYRILDAAGQLVAGPQPVPSIAFEAEPGMTYQLQLAYPATSLFVGLYDDMKFQHTPYWTMPIDARYEHDQEFHLDYHRQNDPDLANDHIRGDVVIDALYLINGTTSVAQQFPYGRHDGALPGVTIVGIPDVSMVAFCQRPGVHEVVYYGGWENESYYLPQRGRIFDQEIYDRWTDDQRGDCIDAAQRVNQTLAREGLRTDHTFRHHGQRSQGFQMTQLHIWSPYNLAGMRPPHIGRFLKPGVVLPYYQEAEDMLFWAWDLDKGNLADGIGPDQLQHHLDALGPVVYGDQTGIHSPDALNH